LDATFQGGPSALIIYVSSSNMLNPFWLLISALLKGAAGALWSISHVDEFRQRPCFALRIHFRLMSSLSAFGPFLVSRHFLAGTSRSKLDWYRQAQGRGCTGAHTIGDSTSEFWYLRDVHSAHIGRLEFPLRNRRLCMLSP
jgi:hypothetical protein